MSLQQQGNNYSVHGSYANVWVVFWVCFLHLVLLKQKLCPPKYLQTFTCEETSASAVVFAEKINIYFFLLQKSATLKKEMLPCQKKEKFVENKSLNGERGSESVDDLKKPQQD